MILKSFFDVRPFEEFKSLFVACGSLSVLQLMNDGTDRLYYGPTLVK